MANKSKDNIEKIISLLEDISIEPSANSEDEEFKLIPSEKAADLSTLDKKTIELIQLINEYERLVNDDFRLNFINGYLNLSRANYNNGTLSKKYGLNSFDLRPYKSCKKIKIDKEEFEMIDLLNIQKEKDKLGRKKKEGESKRTEESRGEKGELHEERSGTVSRLTGRSSNERSLKNRNRKEEKKNETIEIENAKEKVKDPIYQFGYLVPYQLRQAQNYFNQALANSINIINLQNRIKKLANEIELLSRG